jgi:hypothetical protein
MFAVEVSFSEFVLELVVAVEIVLCDLVFLTFAALLVRTLLSREPARVGVDGGAKPEGILPLCVRPDEHSDVVVVKVKGVKAEADEWD